MLFGRKREKEKLSKINYLELTPYPKYDYEENDNGLVDVLVPKFTDSVFGRILQPRLREERKYIRANLDEIGSEVWRLLDGKKKVGDIAEKLDAKLGEKIAPVHERLTKFFTQLYRNGFISFYELEKGD